MTTNNSNRQGTGRHPHKSTEEPYRHTRENQSSSSPSGSREMHAGSQSASHSAGSSGSHSGSGSSDLKSREYKDAQGNIHHHTKTFEQQHGKK